MPAWDFKLNSNEIFGSLCNQIISNQVFADNIRDVKSSLLDVMREDVGLYGDRKNYISTAIPYPHKWEGDAEASKLLQTNRPRDPELQSIVIDKFLQIDLTVDNYLSKRAWMDEGSFAQFNSVILGTIRDAKRLYDATTLNVYIGTTVTTEGKQKIELDLDAVVGSATGEEKQRLKGAAIAQSTGLLLVDLGDVTRDYNDYGERRSYNVDDDLIYVWNSDAVVEVEKRDLPTMYHDMIMDKFAEYTLPGRYFGDDNDATKTTADADTKFKDLSVVTFKGGETMTETADIVRNNEKMKIYKGQTAQAGDVGFFYPGDAVPTGTVIAASGQVKIKTYQKNPKILYKVMHKGSVPYASAYESGTEFMNARAINENHYLTWGHNTLEYLKNYPFITVVAK